MPARDDKKAESFVGQRFGKLVIVKFLGRRGKAAQKYYLCKCDCGNEKEIYISAIRNGKSISCGCVRQEMYDNATIDLTGKVFGKLTAINKDISPLEYATQAYWKCLCECGNYSIVGSKELRNGSTKSCGCQMYNREGKRKFTPLEASINAVFRHYSDGDLSIEKFFELSQMNCFYCGTEPSNKYNAYRGRKTIDKDIIDSYAFIHNGLDRVDNTRGHYLDNVVPCCKKCGTAKLDYTVEEFREWIIRLHTNYINKI